MGGKNNCCCCPVQIEELPEITIGTLPGSEGWSGNSTVCCYAKQWVPTGAYEENNYSHYIVTGVLQSATRETLAEDEYVTWERPLRHKLCVIGGNYYEPWPLILDGPTDVDAAAACPPIADSDILDWICPINRKQVTFGRVTRLYVEKGRIEAYYRVIGVYYKTTKVSIDNVIKWAVSIGVTLRYKMVPVSWTFQRRVEYQRNNIPECYTLQASNETEFTDTTTSGIEDFPYPEVEVPITLPGFFPPSGWSEGTIRKAKLYDVLPESINFDELESITEEEYAELTEISQDCFPYSERPKLNICVLFTEDFNLTTLVCDSFTLPQTEHDFLLLNNNLVEGLSQHSESLNYTYFYFASCWYAGGGPVNGTSTSWSRVHPLGVKPCDSLSDYTVRQQILFPSGSVSIIENSNPRATHKNAVDAGASCFITDPCVWPASALHIFPPSLPGTPTSARYYTATDDTVTSIDCSAGYYPICPSVFLDADYGIVGNFPSLRTLNILTVSQSCVNVPFNPTEICITETHLPLIELSSVSP